jgi:glutaconate CoA-transferase subunit A
MSSPPPPPPPADQPLLAGLEEEDEREPKLVSMPEAISRHVPDGARVVLGTFMEQKIPFAAAHEIIRQERSDLELIGPISDIIFDQLIGAGLVKSVRAAWIGNVMMGSARCFRRAVEKGFPRPIEVIDYSNLTMSLALTAGALGVPYMPTRSTLGTTLQQRNPSLRAYAPPIGEEPLIAVEALRPDVAILPVQRSDIYGNSHNWGSFGVSIEAAHASRAVILVAEEVVPEEVILSDPNRVIFPGLVVSAVVHEPWGCHPSPVQGYYNRDHDYYDEYQKASDTPEAFDEWLYHTVTGIADRRAYLERLGAERIESLKVREHAYANPVDYRF